MYIISFHFVCWNGWCAFLQSWFLMLSWKCSVYCWIYLKELLIHLYLSTPPRDAESTSKHEIRKYIVYETCLMELFEVCPVCKRVCSVKNKVLGTFISVKQLCEYCEYSRIWQSQPLLDSTPAGNLQLSAAVYISGASFFKLQRVNEWISK